MRFCILALLLVFVMFSPPSSASEKQLAVTMDDLPYVYHGSFDAAKERECAGKILSQLDAFNVKIMGFVTGWHVGKPHDRDILAEFVRRGHALGNHTFNHLDLDNVSVKEYGDNIASCQDVIKEWVTGPKYFRYPYLHRGDTVKKRDEVYGVLRSGGYTIVPVTIVAEDWLFDEKLEGAMKKGDPKEVDAVGKAYLAHAIEKTRYYEAMAQKKVTKPIRHILLLHMNQINAWYLNDLLSWYKKNGWTFITTREALLDPVYAMKERMVSPDTISWLERI